MRAWGRLFCVTYDSKKHAANKLASHQSRRRRSLRAGPAGPDELHLQGRRRYPLRHLRSRLPFCQPARPLPRAPPGGALLRLRCRCQIPWLCDLNQRSET
nr:hypothetical protein Iba_chr11cCG10040 [Ipomoea batatas]